MEDSFLALRQEVESSKDLRTCIEKLITIFKNTVHNPTESKFRTLRTGNKTFNESVWKYDASRRMMLSCGWVLEGDNVVLPPDENLTVPLHFLVENREVKPSAKEWVSETKHIIPNEDKEKERQLRREASAKKEKEMAELQKDMAEREAIKSRILAEHRHDQEKRKVPVGGSSKHFDEPAGATSHTGATPRRFRSSNVLGGGSGGADDPTLPATGVHSTAHRRASAFAQPSILSSQHYHQQPVGGTHYPLSHGAGRHASARASDGNYSPSFGVGRHTAGIGGTHYSSSPSYGTGRHARASHRSQQRYNNDDDGEAPLRLGRGAATGRSLGDYQDYYDEDY